MNKYLDLHEIASNEEGLEVVETTSEYSGYPHDLKWAITGFDPSLDGFKAAEELAERYGLKIIELRKHGGQQLWTRMGMQFEPFRIAAENYGDDYEVIEEGHYDEDSFIKTYLKPQLEGAMTFEDIDGIVRRVREVWENIEDLAEGQAVVVNQGYYEDTIYVATTYFQHDTETRIIGLINEDE